MTEQRVVSSTLDGGVETDRSLNRVVRKYVENNETEELQNLSSESPVRLLIHTESGTAVSEVATAVQPTGNVVHTFPETGYLSVKMPLSAVPRLKSADAVERIEIERFHSLSQSADTPQSIDSAAAAPSNDSSGDDGRATVIQTASPVWETSDQYVGADEMHRLGYDGSNATVAVLDTGVYPTAPLRGKITAERDFAPRSQDGDDPFDRAGHGSHVAGIIAASESTVETWNVEGSRQGNTFSPTESESYNTTGVAPGANIINAKVFQQFVVTQQTRTVSLSSGGTASRSISLDSEDWSRIRAEWSNSGTTVDLSLLECTVYEPLTNTCVGADEVNSVTDYHSYEVSPNHVTDTTSTSLHLNTTSGLRNNDRIDAIRIEAPSVQGSGEEQIDVTVQQFAYLAATTDIAQGIEWAAGNSPTSPSDPADVISVSISASGQDPLRVAAIDQAVNDDVVYVTSAGNSGSSTKVPIVKQKSNVITVGSLGRDGSQSSFSQIGGGDDYKPDLMAPGGDISATGTPDRFPTVPGYDNNGTVLSGTSMSTPHVSGAAALYIQAYERKHGHKPSAQEVKAALMGTAVDSTLDPRSKSAQMDPLDTELGRATGKDYNYGAGSVDAYNAYTAFVTEQSGDRSITVGQPTELPRAAPTTTRQYVAPKGTLYWLNESRTSYTLQTQSGLAGTAYDSEVMLSQQPKPNHIIQYQISQTGPVTTPAAMVTTYPTLGGVVNPYRMSGSLSLDEGETGAYAIPVSRQAPFGFVSEHGPVTAYGYWNESGTDADIRLYSPDGALDASSTVNRSIEKVVGTSTAAGGWKLVYEANSGSAVNLTRAQDYPGYPLPTQSALGIEDNVAGNASNPGQVTFNVTVSTIEGPYIYSGFGQPDSSHFDVRVGGKTTNNISVTPVNNREDRYQIVMTPPSQPTTGDYDLNVSFNDTKVGVSHTVWANQTDAVTYSSGGAAGTAAASLIIDRSGSMGGSKIDDAENSASIFATQMTDSDELAVVSYASSATTDLPLAYVDGNRTRAQNAINTGQTRGSTNIGAGMINSRNELDTADPNSRKAAILLTDGQNNQGYTDDEVRNIADTFAAKNYCVYTIAFGSRADEQLLRDIANRTCGTYSQAADRDELQGIYQDIRQVSSGASTISSSSGTVSVNSQTRDQFKIDDSVDSTTLSVNVEISSGPSASNDAAAPTATSGTKVNLYDPSGSKVNTSSNTDVSKSTIDDTTTFRLNSPMSGAWSYEIVNNQQSSLSYTATATASTRTTLTVSADGATYLNGSSAMLTATLIGPNGGLSGGTVEAVVTDRDGNTRNVTLTERSAGTYRGTVSLRKNGTYTASVSAEAGSVVRQKDLSWQVVDQSQLLDASVLDQPSIVEGDIGTINVSLSRPSSTSSMLSGVSSDTLATPGPDAKREFDAAARELAGASREHIRDANVSDATKQAALTMKNESGMTVTADASAVSAPGAVSGDVTVYIKPRTLTSAAGDTIPASAVTADTSVVRLAPSQTKGVTFQASPPDGLPPGTYNGTVAFTVRGTVIEKKLTVKVTEATETIYQQRIRQASQQWQSSGPQGKVYYEDRMADQLINIYFNESTGEAQTKLQPTSPRIVTTAPRESHGALAPARTEVAQ